MTGVKSNDDELTLVKVEDDPVVTYTVSPKAGKFPGKRFAVGLWSW